MIKLLNSLQENNGLADKRKHLSCWVVRTQELTLEEFKEAMLAFNAEAELSDDDLDNVSGGLTENEKIIAGSASISVGVVATAASAAV